jgi:hypothetical protein
MMVAMAVPLLPNKVEAWKSWVRECSTTRSKEFGSFNERMELTLHRAWLSQGPLGPLVIVVSDGPGARTMLQKLASSEEPFDRWFRAKITELHGIDFSKPATGMASEILLDWQSPAYAEAGRL